MTLRFSYTVVWANTPDTNSRYGAINRREHIPDGIRALEFARARAQYGDTVSIIVRCHDDDGGLYGNVT